MAFPNEIQVGRINAILHKLLDIKEGAPAPSLAPDIFAMLALEVDRPEWKFLAGERLAQSSYKLGAGGAGTYGTHVLWNPSTSGMLVVVERIYHYDFSDRLYTLRITGTDPSGTYNTNAYEGLRDSRFGTAVTTKPAAIHYDLATASPTGLLVLGEIAMANGTEMKWDQPYVLGPGTGLTVHNSNAQQTTYIGFLWRERTLEPSELR